MHVCNTPFGIIDHTHHACAEVADPSMDLSQVDNWAEIFSVGEQQRIAFLRLFRNKPALAVLDEATSAMDVATENHMYTLLANGCQSYVSVGHRPQLTMYHSHVLTWQMPGVWTLAPSPNYEVPQALAQHA
jgi:vitamin B12/bleomycin/antimicrobial peptide transport system ATP-binding/permease protein